VGGVPPGDRVLRPLAPFLHEHPALGDEAELSRPASGHGANGLRRDLADDAPADPVFGLRDDALPV
jgi:hypothetical protein